MGNAGAGATASLLADAQLRHGPGGGGKASAAQLARRKAHLPNMDAARYFASATYVDHAVGAYLRHRGFIVGVGFGSAGHPEVNV